MKSKLNNRLKYYGQYTRSIDIEVIWTPQKDCKYGGFLIAYDDDEMEDGFDYEDYEKRLFDGESFESIAKEIIKELTGG